MCVQQRQYWRAVPERRSRATCTVVLLHGMAAVRLLNLHSATSPAHLDLVHEGLGVEVLVGRDLQRTK